MSSQPTEQPTLRRRETARQEGQVARSDDLTNIVALSVLVGYLLFDGARLVRLLIEIIVMPLDYLTLPFEDALRLLSAQLFPKMMMLVVSLLVIAVATSFVVQFVQVGLVVSTKSITPSLKKFNVVSNIKEIFSLNTLVDTFKAVLKTSMMGWIVWMVLKGNLGLLSNLPWGGKGGLRDGITTVLSQFFILVFFSFIVLAFFDYLWQRHSLTKKLMMKKEEVKKERKENEGDPHFKNYRRDLFKELLFGGDDIIKQSSAVVTNPTHLAVALYYDAQITPLPVVVAKAKGVGAMALIRVARSAGVPIIENIPVARGLYRDVEVLTFIPSEMISAIAEIISAAQFIRNAAHHYQQAGEDQQNAS